MSTQPNKLPVSPAARRQLNIAISDLIAAKDSYADLEQYFAALGHLYAQMSVDEEYIPITEQYKSIPKAKEVEGEATTVAYFFANIRDMRKGKIILFNALELDYLPQCRRVGDNQIRYSVRNMTKTTAFDVFNTNRDVFTQIDFLSDIHAAEAAARKAAKPTRVRKLKDPKTFIQPVVEEMLTNQDPIENTDDVIIQSVEENTDVLENQAVEEKTDENEEQIVFKDEALEALLNNRELVIEPIAQKEEEVQSVEDLLGVE